MRRRGASELFDLIKAEPEVPTRVWDILTPQRLAKARSHKYIKREGTPGNYKYTYPEDEGSARVGGPSNMGEKLATPKAGHLVRWARPVRRDDDTVTYTSKCGNYTIERRMVANMSGRSGYFTTPEYRLFIRGQRVSSHDTLADAKLNADWDIDPNWDPDAALAESKGMRLSEAQSAAVDRIKSGDLRSIQSNTVVGQTVESLIEAGVVSYKTKTYERQSTSPWGAVHPGFTAYGGLEVVAPKEPAQPPVEPKLPKLTAASARASSDAPSDSVVSLLDTLGAGAGVKPEEAADVPKSAEEEFVDYWKGVFTKLGKDFDFTKPEDRVAFRLKVDHQTSNMTVRGLRGLATALGAEKVGTSRGDTYLAVANAWMRRQSATSRRPTPEQIKDPEYWRQKHAEASARQAADETHPAQIKARAAFDQMDRATRHLVAQGRKEPPGDDPDVQQRIKKLADRWVSSTRIWAGMTSPAPKKPSE